MTIYKHYIKFLKKLEKTYGFKMIGLEKHHILPLHDGGKKDGPVVLCTAKHHTLAHYYRYLSYGQIGDRVAYKMCWSQTMTARDRSALSVEKRQRLKIIFWNADWQSEQGKKGGSISGVKGTLKQTNARQKVGLRFGLRNDMKNQSKYLKIMLTKTTIWGYKSKSGAKEVQISIPRQKTFSDLISILQSNTVDSGILINKPSFYKVIHGTRKQIYGWRLILIKL